MHDKQQLIEGRVRRVLRERLKPQIYSVVVPVNLAIWTPPPVETQASAASAPSISPEIPAEPVPASIALRQDYTPIHLGEAWGPAWGTSWFHLTVRVPEKSNPAESFEIVFNPGFSDSDPGFQAEGLVYLPDGTIVKALNPKNQWIPVDARTAPNGHFEVYVEAAANPRLSTWGNLQATPQGDKLTAERSPLYRINQAELLVFRQGLWELIHDLETLLELSEQLDAGNSQKFELLYALDRALDRLDLHELVATAPAARAELQRMLAQPALENSHQITAVGHAHIDSAWLWPLRETVRKVGRTTANVVNLMDSYPEFIFVMSQAQQLAWLKEHYPDTFARVKHYVAAGRFIPVGSMWVESDTNLPGCEALARQFVHGKRFFAEEFGVETEEVWLPDSFGYSAALPQIAKAAGARWFLTQKISWNTVNKFPHHTFDWEGLDGTRIFTHFPPVDTYNAQLSGEELAHAARNFQEKGRASRSLVPFGWGDGGGGPTRDMLARAARNQNLAGAPRVRIEPPQEFFSAAEAEYPDRPLWVGELYLELHRGTYTSQAKNKSGNRFSEHLLFQAELWAATAAIRTGFEYPYAALDRIWKNVLLLQFHDILPGTSIAWVHREARENYQEIFAELEEIIQQAQQALAGEGSTDVVFHAAPRSFSDVPGSDVSSHVPVALGASLGSQIPATESSTRRREASGWVLENSTLRLHVDSHGLFERLWDKQSHREVLSGPGNLLQLHPDFPNDWDAWDIDAFYRNTVTDVESIESIEPQGSDSLRIIRTFGESTVEQVITLTGRQVQLQLTIDWQEQEKLLKLAFPVAVHTAQSTAEIQYGHIHRPTHSNTSWDAAKFEICAHRWVHVAESGYGVGLANNATYGYDITKSAEGTVLRASLLRAPRFPDPATDQGVHHFSFSLIPGADIADAVAAGLELNLPPRVVQGEHAVAPLVTVDHQAIVLSAVKLADDGSGDLILRLYESLGGRARSTLRFHDDYAAVWYTDLLERPVEQGSAEQGLELALDDHSVQLELRPFQIVTLRLQRRSPSH